jgi:hypothetical protein
MPFGFEAKDEAFIAVTAPMFVAADPLPTEAGPYLPDIIMRVLTCHRV